MIDAADDGPVDTALREASEEVGLSRSDIVDVLGGLTPVHTRSVTMRIVPVVARVRRPTTLVAQPEEVAAILEPSIDDLLDDAGGRPGSGVPVGECGSTRSPRASSGVRRRWWCAYLLGYFRRDAVSASTRDRPPPCSQRPASGSGSW